MPKPAIGQDFLEPAGLQAADGGAPVAFYPRLPGFATIMDSPTTTTTKQQRLDSSFVTPSSLLLPDAPIILPPPKGGSSKQTEKELTCRYHPYRRSLPPPRPTSSSPGTEAFPAKELALFGPIPHQQQISYSPQEHDDDIFSDLADFAAASPTTTTTTSNTGLLEPVDDFVLFP